MNLLSGVCPVRGERRGRAAEVIEGFGDGSSQAGAKVADGTRGKINRF